MIKDDLIALSPVRSFEKAIDGGLQPGEIGIIAAPRGIGKTSVLVQIAMDKLLQGKKVIHISFTQEADYVRLWYQNIFDEFIRQKNVQNKEEINEELRRNRILLNFNQEGVTNDVIRASVKSIIVEGGYKAETIIIDGFDFSIAAGDRITTLKNFAREIGFCLWYSCSMQPKDYDKRFIPNVILPFEDCIDVVFALEQKNDCIELDLVKNRAKYNRGGDPLRLDPKTLLLLKESK